MGKIHSIETMGALDGPGIRMIIYFQGCPLRCLYCHNPDTWNMAHGIEMSADEVVEKAKRYKPYFTPGKGGVTFSGGEPLMQPEFLIQCLRGCKRKGIHTALDTSGAGIGKYEEILEFTDLVILDIKHEEAQMYEKLTGASIEAYHKFKRAVLKKNKKVWLKHVVVPGLTDAEWHLEKLKKEIYSFNNIEKVELLPYHTMGIHKYECLNLPYALSGVEAMDKKKLETLQRKLLQCPVN